MCVCVCACCVCVCACCVCVRMRTCDLRYTPVFTGPDVFTVLGLTQSLSHPRVHRARSIHSTLLRWPPSPPPSPQATRGASTPPVSEGPQCSTPHTAHTPHTLASPPIQPVRPFRRFRPFRPRLVRRFQFRPARRLRFRQFRRPPPRRSTAAWGETLNTAARGLAARRRRAAVPPTVLIPVGGLTPQGAIPVRGALLGTAQFL